MHELPIQNAISPMAVNARRMRARAGALRAANSVIVTSPAALKAPSQISTVVAGVAGAAQLGAAVLIAGAVVLVVRRVRRSHA
jgi:hypothetical protein